MLFDPSLELRLNIGELFFSLSTALLDLSLFKLLS